MKCVECKKEIKLTVQVTKEFGVGEHRVGVTVPGHSCCGESFIEGKHLKAAELAVAAMFAKSGVADGAVLRFQRKAMGMTAKTLADLLGMSPEHISRMENGKKEVTRLVAVVVGSMVRDLLEGESRTSSMLAKVKAPIKPQPVTIPNDLSHLFA